MVNRDMAVKIARDVLAQLRADKYIACTGTYNAIEGTKEICLDIEKLSNKKLQKLLLEKDTECSVCALGSIFTSMIRLEDGITGKSFQSFNGCFNDSSGQRKLKEYFDKEDLLLMEYVFECGMAGALYQKTQNRYNNHNYDTSMLDKATDYGCKYLLDNERLRIIMMNVIRNKGRFILPKRVK